MLQGQPLFTNPGIFGLDPTPGLGLGMGMGMSKGKGKGKGKDSQNSSMTDPGQTNLVTYMSQLVAHLGLPQQEFASRSETALDCFDRNIENWVPILDAKIRSPALEEQEKRFTGEEKEAFLQFMRSTLTWMPEDRKTAKELLNDPWLNKGAV